MALVAAMTIKCSKTPTRFSSYLTMEYHVNIPFIRPMCKGRNWSLLALIHDVIIAEFASFEI